MGKDALVRMGVVKVKGSRVSTVKGDRKSEYFGTSVMPSSSAVHDEVDYGFGEDHGNKVGFEADDDTAKYDTSEGVEEAAMAVVGVEEAEAEAAEVAGKVVEAATPEVATPAMATPGVEQVEAEAKVSATIAGLAPTDVATAEAERAAAQARAMSAMSIPSSAEGTAGSFSSQGGPDSGEGMDEADIACRRSAYDAQRSFILAMEQGWMEMDSEADSD